MLSGLDQQNEPPRMTDSKAASLRLALSDFVVIDRFQGFYEYGRRDRENKQGHTAIINAKWKHGLQSDKIFLSGMEITTEAIVQFIPTTDRADTERSWADQEALVVFMMEDVFWPLVKAVQRSDVQQVILTLRAEPHEQLDDRLHLVFGNIEISHKNITEQGGLSEMVRRFEYILYAIGVMLIMILFELYRR